MNGVWTALVTPFLKGEIDYDSLKKLIQFQEQSGVQGFVVSGTTGESPTLSKDEKKHLLEFVMKQTELPVMFGSGTNSTKESIELSQSAQKWGAKSLLLVVPYYNKPPQRGLIEHFRQISDSVEVPVMLYNVPGRTVAALNLDSIQTLSKNKNIFGIKEATGDVKFGAEIVKSCPGFVVFSGDDGSCVELATHGSQGVISVVSHIFPKELSELHEQARNKKTKAVESFARFSKLTSMLFSEANPIPVKAALKLMGIIRSDELRLPLVAAQEKLVGELKNEMKGLGIL